MVGEELRYQVGILRGQYTLAVRPAVGIHEHGQPAAGGIFVTQVHGLADHALPAMASLGVRPTVEDAGRVLLEVHCLRWPGHLGADGAYGKIVAVDLLQKIRDEARYEGLDALALAIAGDVNHARAYFASAHASQARHITRDRI